MKISEVADDNQKLFDNMYSRGVADKSAGRDAFPPGQKGSFAHDAYMRGYGPLKAAVPRRPDRRPTNVVRHWFDMAFAIQNYPNVSWALGSDWGMGSRSLSAAEYKAAAYKRFAAIYGA